MNRPVRIPLRRQDGIAAVELAAMLLLLSFMLMFPLFLGKVMWQYTALQKATHDATRYLASVPTEDIRDQARFDAVAKMANNIINMEMAELNSGQNLASPTIQCDGDSCVTGTVVAPNAVTIKTHLAAADTVFPATIVNYLGSASLLLQANVTFPFQGN